MLILLVAVLAAVAQAVLPAASTAQPRPGAAELNLVFVLDGLRPDSINPDDTPTIFGLQREGVHFTRSHSAVPTVTRVNGAVIGTGMHPGSNGMVGNAMYIPEIDPTSAISTANPNTMLELEEKTGDIVFTDTLAERLQERGKKMVSVGSATPGGGPFLTNPTAPHGTGVMITTADPASGVPLAWPDEVGNEILDRFGPPPGGSSNEAVDYSTQVVNDYVLTELDPDVLLFWMIEPDQAQHSDGVGSPEAISALRNDDRNIGAVLDRLDQLGMADKTNVFVISDHGFTLNVFGVNVERELIEAGLKSGQDSDDVIVAITGSALVYVKDRDPKRIKAITEFLQRQEWAGALYTAARKPAHGRYRTPGQQAPAEGWVDGTFSLELIHQGNAERGADILVTFPWSSETNSFGVPGSAYRALGGETGPRSGPGSGHGSFSPYDVTNTLIASGPDVKDGSVSHVPAGAVDVAPTILSLATGVEGSFDGRVLSEALTDGPDAARIPVTTRVYTTQPKKNGFAAAVQVSLVGDSRYIDKSWRVQ